MPCTLAYASWPAYWVGLASGIRGFGLHTPADDERLAAVSLFSIAVLT